MEIEEIIPEELRNDVKLALLTQHSTGYFTIECFPMLQQLHNQNPDLIEVRDNRAYFVDLARLAEEVGIDIKDIPQSSSTLKNRLDVILARYDPYEYFPSLLCPAIKNTFETIIFKTMILVTDACLDDQGDYRRRIHLLFYGKAGTGKTTLLRWYARLMNYLCATQISSEAGLTASFQYKEPKLGLIPLSDGRGCIIEELDKYDAKERRALLEPMEDGTLTITKAGENHIFDARVRIFANANISELIPEQVMNRFDFKVVIDNPDVEAGKSIADHIFEHWDGHAGDTNADLLKYYMQRVRRFNPNPLSDEIKTKGSALIKKFLDVKPKDEEKVNVRDDILRYIRIGQAIARMRFRDVELTDIMEGIKLNSDIDHRSMRKLEMFYKELND